MTNLELIIDSLIEKAKQEEGIIAIRSRFGKEYDRPDIIKIKGKKRKVTPDLEIETGNQTNLYIVEQDSNYDIEKWRLLSLYVMKIQGNFYIVAPKDYESHISRKLEESRISAHIIYFSQ